MSTPAWRPPSGPADPEIHIAGVLVHARAPALAAVCRAIADLPEAEVTQCSLTGRVVVVLEAASGHAVLQVIDSLRAIEGVVDVALVYQHAEPASALSEPVDRIARLAPSGPTGSPGPTGQPAQEPP